MTKYNAKKTTVNGITFDSILESKYYLHLLKEREKGYIKDFTLQPTFTLQEGFTHCNKRIQPIKYKADFKILHNNDLIEIVDVKGKVTEVAKIKIKMFKYRFPDLNIKLVTYVKKWGGWIELEELQRLRKVAKNGTNTNQ